MEAIIAAIIGTGALGGVWKLIAGRLGRTANLRDLLERALDVEIDELLLGGSRHVGALLSEPAAAAQVEGMLEDAAYAASDALGFSRRAARPFVEHAVRLGMLEYRRRLNAIAARNLPGNLDALYAQAARVLAAFEQKPNLVEIKGRDD